MSYEVNNTPEDHGYTIRLVKRTFTDGGKKEIAETIATLAIIDDKNEADAVMEALNVFIAVCSKNLIFDKNLFRHIHLKEFGK